jgi:hypothetical protein
MYQIVFDKGARKIKKAGPQLSSEQCFSNAPLCKLKSFRGFLERSGTEMERNFYFISVCQSFQCGKVQTSEKVADIKVFFRCSIKIS